tara:strand:+ start:3291 stop:3728 length:438 start_codon:yes stop_codon:yes gene_type:complete
MPIVEFTNLNKYGNMRTRRFWRESSNLSFNPDGFGPFVNYRLFKYDYKGILPPAILKLGGKTYIVPSWQEVLPETRLEDINWIKPKIKKTKETVIVETLSSKGDKMYKTRFYPDTGNYSCTCPGTWMSNNNCKHIKKLRNEQEGK